MIYVRSKEGKALMSTERCSKIGYLLRHGMAHVVSRVPFVVQLDYETSTYTQDVSLGIDAGSKHIGVSASSEKKDLFALQSARASDIEEEIKDFREQKKAELKPIKEEISSLLKEIKQKGSMVNEKVYKFVDRDSKMTAFYDKEGNLVSSRPATRDELPKNMYSIIRDKQAM